MHCKNENVYGTLYCPKTHTVFAFGVHAYWKNLVFRTHLFLQCTDKPSHHLGTQMTLVQLHIYIYTQVIVDF